MTFTPEDKNKIIDALKEHSVKDSCPRCGTDAWGLVDGYLQHIISDDPERMLLGGRVLPTVGVLCANCGFLSEYSVIILGLRPPFNTDTDKQSPKERDDESRSPDSPGQVRHD
jgi:hypothetical protein